jgi:hypothetical protein
MGLRGNEVDGLPGDASSLAGKKLEGGMEEKLLCGDFQRVVSGCGVCCFISVDTKGKSQKDGHGVEDRG